MRFIPLPEFIVVLTIALIILGPRTLSNLSRRRFDGWRDRWS